MLKQAEIHVLKTENLWSWFFPAGEAQAGCIYLLGVPGICRQGQDWAVFILSPWKDILSAVQGMFQGFTWHFIENDFSSGSLWGSDCLHCRSPWSQCLSARHTRGYSLQRASGSIGGQIQTLKGFLFTVVSWWSRSQASSRKPNTIKHAALVHGQSVRVFVLCKTNLAWHYNVKYSGRF